MRCSAYAVWIQKIHQAQILLLARSIGRPSRSYVQVLITDVRAIERSEQCPNPIEHETWHSSAPSLRWLLVGCAGGFQATDSGSSAAFDSLRGTSIQDSIDRMNQQVAMDAANGAAQQRFLAGMAAAQETMNNANNDRATSNW